MNIAGLNIVCIMCSQNKFVPDPFFMLQSGILTEQHVMLYHINNKNDKKNTDNRFFLAQA